MLSELYGLFHSYIYGPDEHTGYAVLRVRTAPGSYVVCEPYGCAAPVGLTYGTPLKMNGEFREGRQFNYPCNGEPGFLFQDAVQTMPRDEASAIEFIENMQIRGIANGNAKRIIDVTGVDIESYFKKNPDAEDFRNKLHSGVPLASIEAFIRRIMTTTTQKSLLDIMYRHGATYAGVSKLYKELIKAAGHECTIDEILDMLSPHLMNAEGEVPNGCYFYCAKADIAFDTADFFAKELGYRAYHPERLRSLVMQAMQNIASSGHIWSSIEDIYNVCRAITSRTAFSGEYISKWAIYATVKTTPWWFKEFDNGSKIYLESSWFDEIGVVSNIRRIQATSKVLPYYDSIVTEIEKERNIIFSAAQKECFEFLKETGVRIVTGGAGTGKTTTISGLLTAYTRLNPNASVALCAPTGRAAQRMTELCKTYGSNVKAFTIHKLLDFQPFEGNAIAKYDETNPLGADMLIVDEMSMVDLHLFSLLMRAVKDGALLILCGDANQLPSVAAGRVFWDMIESGKFHVVRLTANYRQGAGGSDIIQNAERINSGNGNLMSSAEFCVINCENDSEMRKRVEELIRKDPEQTVLTTIRNHNAGVRELNKALQPIINTTRTKGISFGDMTFRENDHIIMTRNNYDVGYVNGDVGTIESVTHHEMVVRLGNETKVIERTNFGDVSLAYAMTIHKSQGSEYDSVIVVLPPSAPHMMARNLLYTAVTRGKKRVTVLAKQGDIARAVANVRNAERRTTLKQLLTT